MARSILGLSLAGAIALSTPGWSQDQTEHRAPSALEQARTSLADGKPEQAIALVDPIIAEAFAGQAKKPDAMCPSAVVAVLAQFIGDPNVRLSAENDWCDAMLVKGYALGELGRHQEAAEVLGKLVAFDKTNANYWSEYAFALRSSGDLDGALASYQHAKSAASRYRDPPAKRRWRAVALRGIGYIAFERQDWAAAEKAYKDSLKDDPGNEIALSELALIKQRRAR